MTDYEVFYGIYYNPGERFFLMLLLLISSVLLQDLAHCYQV